MGQPGFNRTFLVLKYNQTTEAPWVSRSRFNRTFLVLKLYYVARISNSLEAV